MSARKSLPGRSSRHSRYSIQSQLSGVLNPDSNLISDDEANPLWFKELENHSIRPSARFSLARHDTPILDSNSEPESTPLQKDWWKYVDNTPYFKPSRPNVSRERSDVQEKSNVEPSDTSSLEESIGKKRPNPLRRSKRKGIQKNDFDQILDSAKDHSTTSEKIPENRPGREKQDTIISSSESDISIEKVRRQPFRSRMRAKLNTKPLHIESGSDDSPPEEFQDALDGLQSPNKSGHQEAADNIAIQPARSLEEEAPPAKSLDNAEPVRQRVENTSLNKQKIAAVEAEGTLFEDDLEGSRSPALMARTKKRTKFTRTTKRKTANFDDLLDNASEGPLVADQSSVRGEVAVELDVELNQNERGKQSGTQISQHTDKDDLEGSRSPVLMARTKKRTRFTRTSKRRTANFDDLLNNASEDSLVADQSSVRGEMAVELDVELNQNERGKQSGTQISQHTDKDDLEGSRSPVLMARTKKRTRFTRTSKRRTANFDDLLNNASEDSLVADQSSVRGEMAVELDVALNQNERGKESGTQIPQHTDLSTHSLAQEGESDSENSVVRSRVPFLHKKRKNRQEESFTQFLASPETSVRSELVSPPKQTGEHEFLEPESQRSNAVERRSSKRRSIPAEGNQSAEKLSHSYHSTNESATQRRSTNKKIDQARISQSSSIELEVNDSLRISTRLSGTDRRSMSRKDSHAEISQHSDIDLEDNELGSVSRPSSVSNKSAAYRSFTNKENDRAEVFAPPLIVEFQADQAVNIPIRSATSSNTSGIKRRSMIKTIDKEQEIILNDSQINKNRSSTRAGNTSRRVHNQSKNNELLVSADDKEDEEEISINIEDLASSSGVIDRTQGNQEYTKESISQRQNTSSVYTATTALADLVYQKSADQKERASDKKRKSMAAQNPEVGATALQEHNRDVTRVRNRSVANDGVENNTILESRVTGVGTITQSIVNRTERSFSSVDHTRPRSMQIDASVGIESQSLNAEKMSQIKNALDEVKKKELALMKNTRIDSYFKKVSSTKQDAAIKNSQTAQKKTKPGDNQRKNTASTSPSKAYLVNGKVYKRPSLPRPKPWVTDRLYNFLWKKLEPSYKLRTRIRSEKFILDMSQVVALVVRRQKYENYKKELETLIQEMARLGIIKTRNDFHRFCQDFLPYEFRIKVIPMLLPGNVRNMPFHPNKLHTPILSS